MTTIDVLNALTCDAQTLDVQAAAATYRELGCLQVRGLGRAYIPRLMAEVHGFAAEALALFPRAEQSPGVGWWGPDGSLFLPAPASFGREHQIQLLGMGYHSSAEMLRCAMDSRTLDLVEAVLGPDIELFGDGQVPYKEPRGGYLKHLHQDAAYFDHQGEGPMAVLIYGVDTDLHNGALHVVPGSHRQGTLRHQDTDSHQGLDWRWEDAVPLPGKAGDAIFFHVRTVHGSQENHSASPRPSLHPPLPARG